MEDTLKVGLALGLVAIVMFLLGFFFLFFR